MASKRTQDFTTDSYYQLPIRKDILNALKRICQISAIVVISIASTVLVGWFYNNDLLKSITPALPSMKANTAIALLLSGLSLLLTQRNPGNIFFWLMQKLSAAAVIIIGVLTLSQYITGINIGIDELFFKEPFGEIGTASPNRMAPNSALLFILCGLALIFVDKKASRTWVSQVLSVMASIVLLPTIIGYVYNIEFIYGVATTTKMAIHTAVAFILLISGILIARPIHGFMAILPRDDAGGFLARRLALTGILIPFALGWIILQGYSSNLYDSNFRYLLLIGMCVIVFTYLIWRNAVSLSIIDEKRKKAEAFLSHMAAIVQTSDDAIISRTVDGKILSWNRGAEKMYGYTQNEIRQSSVDLLIPKNKKSELNRVTKKIARGQRIEHLETQRVRKDGKIVDVSISFSPIVNEKGKVTAISTIARDITEQKNAENVLQMRVRQQAVVSELGLYAISGMELSDLMNRASKLVAKVLNVEFTKILELQHDTGTFILRGGHGWHKSVRLNEYRVDAGRHSQSGYTLLVKKPVVVKDLRTDKRFIGPDLLSAHNVISGMSCIIFGRNKPYGVIGVHTTKRRDFTNEDLNFLQAVANLLAMTIERKELEKQKDDFISIASHELKTPVTSIKSYGQVLQVRFKKEGNKNAVILLSKMDSQLDKLTNLIGDLLDVTKIATGRLQYNNDYYQFDDLVSELVEEMQRTTNKHTIVKKGKTKKKIFGDRERTGQVLTNLISNAIKYSPSADKITIESSVDDEFVKVSVIDYGVGIAKEKQDQVFERFFRINGPGKDTYPGLGLGLYICAEIIKRQGGRIWVESEEGKGSTFSFTLPIKPLHNGATDTEKNYTFTKNIV